MQKCNEY